MKKLAFILTLTVFGLLAACGGNVYTMAYNNAPDALREVELELGEAFEVTEMAYTEYQMFAMIDVEEEISDHVLYDIVIEVNGETHYVIVLYSYEGLGEDSFNVVINADVNEHENALEGYEEDLSESAFVESVEERAPDGDYSYTYESLTGEFDDEEIDEFLD